jgi:hypothetical protein
MEVYGLLFKFLRDSQKETSHFFYNRIVSKKQQQGTRRSSTFCWTPSLKGRCWRIPASLAEKKVCQDWTTQNLISLKVVLTILY